MPVPVGEASDEVAELAGLAVVEPGGGLVEQQHRRCRRDRPGDPDETPPAVGKLARAGGRGRARARTRGALLTAVGRERRSGRPDQVAEAGEARADSGAGVEVLGDRDLLEELERLERTPHAGARAPSRAP